jgi:DNA-binding NtrC family response regulator
MILVVDDDPLLAGALAVAFEKEGYRVQIANDGGEAYRYLKDSECKLLLLDMHMPRINGAELLILMANEGIEVPTVAMSSFRDFTAAELKEFPGVVAFLRKPFEVSELVELAKRHAPKVPPRKKRGPPGKSASEAP